MKQYVGAGERKLHNYKSIIKDKSSTAPYWRALEEGRD